MPTFAQGSRTELLVAKEDSLGVLPATPTYRKIPKTTHTLNGTKGRLEGRDIYADRMQRVDRHGVRSAGGNIVADLRQLDFDPFLESLLHGTFTSPTGDGILVPGFTRSSFTIVDAQGDLNSGAGLFREFKGMEMNTLSLTVSPEEPVASTFDFVGVDALKPTAVDPTTGATINEVNSIEPFDAFSGSVDLGGVPITYLSSLSLNITNSKANLFAVGSRATQEFEFGMLAVTGTASFYYQDPFVQGLYDDEIETSLSFSVTNPEGWVYGFSMDRVKFNTGNIDLSNPQTRFVEVDFVSLYDPTATNHLSISRTAPIP